MIGDWGLGRESERGLVDVEAAADDATADGVSAEFVLDKDASEFTVACINVIRPLDGEGRESAWGAVRVCRAGGER